MNEHDAIEQLAALLDGDIDRAAAPASLASLVTLADTVRDHADVVAPTPEFRASLRQELVAAAEPAPGLVERVAAAWAARTARLRHSARLAVATLTTASMVGSAGVAVAAQQAMPGDVLYGLKDVTEDARILLATNEDARARLHLRFARERLLELQTTADRLSTDGAVALLAEMDGHSQTGAEALIGGSTTSAIDPAEVTEVHDFATDQRDGLVALFGNLPLLAKPVAEESLELLRRIQLTVSGTASVADCDCDRTAAGPLPPARTGVDTTRPPSLPTVTVIAAPGDGPALPDLTCDCVELPGGPVAREPARDTASEASGGSEEHERGAEPFQPTGELADPEPSGEESTDAEDGTGSEDGTGTEDETEDGTGSRDRSGLDSLLSDLDGLLDRSTTLLEGPTDVEPDAGPIDRLTEPLVGRLLR